MKRSVKSKSWRRGRPTGELGLAQLLSIAPSSTCSENATVVMCSSFLPFFVPGCTDTWHYDESPFSTTLLLQKPEEGGKFEYTRPIRVGTKVSKRPETTVSPCHNSTARFF